MRENEASRTAEYMALFRAIGVCATRRPTAVRRSLCARVPAPRLAPCRRGGRHSDRRERHSLDHRRAGPAPARPEWPARADIDEELVRALNGGTRQVVILGAGFDCRAYRIAGIEQERVFELDHPATQQAKRHCLTRLLGAMPDHVELVGIDFNRQSLDERLPAAGLVATSPTLWIWEGVTNYLTAAAVDGTLPVRLAGRLQPTRLYLRASRRADRQRDVPQCRRVTGDTGPGWRRVDVRLRSGRTASVSCRSRIPADRGRRLCRVPFSMATNAAASAPRLRVLSRGRCREHGVARCLGHDSRLLTAWPKRHQKKHACDSLRGADRADDSCGQLARPVAPFSQVA